MEPSTEPSGHAALADRPVDERRVAFVMAAVGLALAAACAGAVEHLLASANAEPDGGRMLRALASDGPRPAAPPGRAAVVLLDGLRVDAARRLPSLGARGVRGTLALPTPTLSRPFYHLLLTGVPPDASGVRTNRFAARARHDSVADRVRAAGGRVFFVADGLDWMRRMHGRAGDGGSDAPNALGAPLDEALRAWRAAPAPALLVVHALAVDRAAHATGVRSAAHRAALARADALVARVRRAAEAAPGADAAAPHGPTRVDDREAPSAADPVAPAEPAAPGAAVAAAEPEARAGPAAPGAADAAAEPEARAGPASPDAAGSPAAVFVVSDHGHLDEGGHGGPEPEVARAPLWVRAPGRSPGALEAPVDPARLAATLATWLGVRRPRAAVGAPLERLARATPARDRWHARAAGLVEAGRRAGRMRLSARRRWTLPLALILVVLTLGPIKRAFAFDRAVPAAMILWPALLLLGHLALGRPLSLSAIDEKDAHTVRVALLGLGAFVLTLAATLPLARDGLRRRLRRLTATVGWTAWACAAVAVGWVGAALGPWPLSPLAFYLPLLFGGAAAATLAAAALVLLATGLTGPGRREAAADVEKRADRPGRQRGAASERHAASARGAATFFGSTSMRPRSQ